MELRILPAYGCSWLCLAVAIQMAQPLRWAMQLWPLGSGSGRRRCKNALKIPIRSVMPPIRDPVRGRAAQRACKGCLYCLSSFGMRGTVLQEAVEEPLARQDACARRQS
jgi:hypothetical protein